MPRLGAHSSLQNALLLPSLPKQPYANRCIRITFNIFHLQQFILPPKCQEVCKEGIEMGLRAKVQDLRIVRMVYVREYAEKLTIDRAHCCGKGRMERVVYSDKIYHQTVVLRGDRSPLTRLCREDVLVINEVLNRGHNIVDVGWCWEIGLFSTRVRPEVVQADHRKVDSVMFECQE